MDNTRAWEGVPPNLATDFEGEAGEARESWAGESGDGNGTHFMRSRDLLVDACGMLLYCFNWDEETRSMKLSKIEVLTSVQALE
jgi:hypothetical protein